MLEQCFVECGILCGYDQTIGHLNSSGSARRIIHNME